MLALTWVGVLIERGAIKACEPVLILRKMAGDPVENYADASLVKAIDEITETHSGFPKREVGAKYPGDLIPPGTLEGIAPQTGRNSTWV
jgi:hypothetical protein